MIENVSRLLRLLLFSAAIFVVAGSHLLQAATASFDEGNRKYAAGDIAGAKQAYEAAILAGERSANLFYNLGNAEFRLGNEGPAILNYERALALAPEHPEARANLDYVRIKSGARVPDTGFLRRAADQLSGNTWVWFAVLSGWAAIFALGARIGLGVRGPVSFVYIVGFLVCAISLAALFVQRPEYHMAIVLKKETAHLAPAESAATAAELPAGSRVQVLQDHGAWMYCLLPDHSRVWIPGGALEKIHTL